MGTDTSDGYRDAWVRNNADRNRCVRIVKERREPCFFCGNPIDLRLKYPHPWSHTVHHVIPKRVAPERVFDTTNMRSAHSRCNKTGTAAMPPATTRRVNSRVW